jgi:hypothetical protein
VRPEQGTWRRTAGDGGELLARSTLFLFSKPKAPTQSRQWEVSVLTTYRDGDGPRTAGDGEAAQSVLGDSEGGLR